MNNNQHNNDTLKNFPDEIAYLKEINRKIDDTLQTSDDRIKQTDTDYKEFKQYTLNHNIDPHEAFQNELLLKQVDRSGAFFVKMRNLTAKSIKSPYFARIDFLEIISPTFYPNLAKNESINRVLLKLQWYYSMVLFLLKPIKIRLKQMMQTGRKGYASNRHLHFSN
jgi:DNA helicase IV